MDKCPYKYNTKEYHAWHSRAWYSRLTDEQRVDRMKIRTQARRNKKAEWVEKLGSKCVDCDGIYPDFVFDFHHEDITTKDRDPAQLFMLSDENIKKELDKCVMLCANCHRMRHGNQTIKS